MSTSQKEHSTSPEGVWRLLAGEKAVTPEKIHAILKSRAKILGRESAKTAPEQKLLEVIVFRLADENYAIELRFIREVYPLRELTPVPGIPSFVIGVANFRGQIISVIDLKDFFRLPRKTVGERDKLLVIHDEQMEFGIQADSILGVRRFAESDFQAPLPTLDGIREKFLKGVTNDRLIVLDGGKLLSDRNLIIHKE
ncbi:MAG: purine-binding chemotaxis protein CheW [Candidatus Riflebacteria bacterium]|nr:purine-binding chemotaxis protein CheW [Candidatus Riflebacteria bacterium]